MVSSRRNDGTITQELRYPFAGTAVQFRQESSLCNGFFYIKHLKSIVLYIVRFTEDIVNLIYAFYRFIKPIMVLRFLYIIRKRKVTGWIVSPEC